MIPANLVARLCLKLILLLLLLLLLHWNSRYDNCKSVVNALQERRNAYDAFVNLMEDRCEFSKAGFSNVWAINHAHHLKVTFLSKLYKDTIDADTLGVVFDQALKFVLPLAAAAGSVDAEVPWLLKGKSSLQCIEWVNRPMIGSVIYKAKGCGTYADSMIHGPQPSTLAHHDIFLPYSLVLHPVHTEPVLGHANPASLLTCHFN